MSTRQENVQSATNSSQTSGTGYQVGDTVTIGSNEATIVSFNDDGSITLSIGDDSFTVVEVDEGTDGAVEYGGS